MYIEFFLFLLVNGQSWSYLVSPYDRPRRSIPQDVPDSKDVGEPLILTPYINSNQSQILKARVLSNVDPLLHGSGIVSHSGYFTVDQEHNSNLFFWFIRKTTGNWTESPLVLWLQGGPGATSLFGLFEENGPYMVTSKGLVQLREHSWTKYYNVLYIDQPVGSGFSFTRNDAGYVRNQTQIADHLYEALTQFFRLFPELRYNPFYIAGESYAGKYIPAISHKIHGLKRQNLTSINLKGLFMISPYTNGLENGYVNFCHQVGLIDSKTKQELEPMEELIESYVLSKSWNAASNKRYELHDIIREYSASNTYDYTKSDTPVQETFTTFVHLSDIRKKIHVGNSTFQLSSDIVSQFLEGEKAMSVTPWIEDLLEYYPMAFVGGQYDPRVAYPVVVNMLKKLKWSGAYNYRRARRNQFHSEGRVAAYYKTAGNLIEVLVRMASHLVPRDQPKVTLDLLKQFVDNELVYYA